MIMKRNLLFMLFAILSIGTWADEYTDVTTLLVGNAKFANVSSGWYDTTQEWSTDISGGNLRVLSHDSGNDVDAGECTSQPNSLERWTSSSFASYKRVLYKQISLPNGRYSLRMAAQAANLNASDKANADSVYVFANNAKAKVTNARALKYYDVETTVTDGSLTIGIATGAGNKCNYANIADVTLSVANGTLDCSSAIEALTSLSSGTDEKISYLVQMMRDSESDYDKVEAYTKASDAAWEYSVKHASVTSPVDVSSWVNNASCTLNTGWSRNGADAAANYNTNNSEFNNSLYSGTCIESWYWSPVKGANLIWQKLSGLMPGTYKVKALCVGQVYNDNSNKGQCLQGLSFFAGDKSVAIDSPTWKEYELEFEVAAGEDVTIGITASSDNLCDWTGITKVELSLTGMGALPELYLSDDYDCNSLQSDGYADVTLRLQMRKGDYATLCLPFDMPMSTAKSCFSEIAKICGVSAVGNDLEISKTDVSYMEAGEVYVVKAAKNIEGTLTIDGVMVRTTIPSSLTTGAAKVGGSYRAALSTAADYLLLKDGTDRMHTPAVGTTLKAYSARVTK